MSNAAQAERATQNRVVDLFRNELGYRYLGNLEKELDNSNIREQDLRNYLQATGKYAPELIDKAIFSLKKASAINTGDELYPTNKAVYSILRYGVKERLEAGENKETVQLIDWDNPAKNDFAIAEEVTIKNQHTRRPDLVLYINGIAMGMIELKRAGVTASEGIRQCRSNQDELFIKSFFTTIQLVMAGNDSQGLYYGTTLTSEKYFLKWKEDNDVYNEDEILLDKHLKQFCSKARLLEIVHNFVIFDNGVKKLCRPNQYFGVIEAQKKLAKKEGGIIWHTQGSGKSLTMVWLAKWILENKPGGAGQRVLIVTDRTELDEQIEGVFNGVEESIVRPISGVDLVEKLNATSPRLLCSLIHKFGGKDENSSSQFIEDLKIPKDFRAKGDFVVFIDECHRTQSGDLHKAMKALLPDAIFI
ncbi:MAG: HsdR family type I site-specific deoxyribonuclease, partial [Candidatus Saccharibacteria bacterium]|nr:HsdR family type I site-specific deoxyribonuclease [Moraxellaceae bacterium]